MKSKGGQPHGDGKEECELSCFRRCAEDEKTAPVGTNMKSTKTEVVCRECGQTFVKYTYSRLSRCEACRKLDAKPVQGNKK